MHTLRTTAAAGMAFLAMLQIFVRGDGIWIVALLGAIGALALSLWHGPQPFALPAVVRRHAGACFALGLALFLGGAVGTFWSPHAFPVVAMTLGFLAILALFDAPNSATPPPQR